MNSLRSAFQPSLHLSKAKQQQAVGCAHVLRWGEGRIFARPGILRGGNHAFCENSVGVCWSSVAGRSGDESRLGGSKGGKPCFCGGGGGGASPPTAPVPCGCGMVRAVSAPAPPGRRCRAR